MIAVVVTPARFEALGALLLPTTEVYAGANDTCYRLYHVPSAARDHDVQEYRDLDGTPIISTRFFPTRTEAERWIDRDIALRAAQTGRVQ